MKKILLIIFLFLFACEVKAKTYYSEFGDFSSYDENEIISNELTQVESTVKYQLYEEKETYEYLESYNGELTGKIKEVETEWVDDYNLIDSNKPIEKCYKYENTNVKEFKHLYIESNFDIIMKNLKIITHTGKVVLEKNNIKLPNFATYHFDLSQFGYTFDQIELEVIYEKENKNENGELIVNYYLNIVEDHTNFHQKIKDISIVSNNISEDVIENKINDFSIYSSYGNICFEEIPSNGRGYKTYYRNKYTLKEYKVINKVYLEEFASESKDGYLIDLDRTKKFYRFKTRDKVEIKDNLIIDNYDVKLTDFIIDSTIPLENIKIISNVDYSKNGNYTIKFILPFKTIEENIDVNIEKNFVDTINRQIEYINDLKNVNEISNYAVDKKNLEIKELIVEEENKITNTLHELDACYKNVANLKNQKQKFKVVNEEKNYKSLYIFILLLLIIALIVIKKNIHKKII